MNGLAFAAHFAHASTEHANIFLTAARDDALRQPLPVGGDDFIAKPATAATVRARLKIHLERLEYSQRLERVRDGSQAVSLQEDTGSG